MAEIKSFRITDETKERLEALSASIGGNKDKVFNTLMDAYSIEQEKHVMTDQAKNIETFEQYSNVLVRLYLDALRAVSSSDDRIRSEFHNQLEENAKTIKELRLERDRSLEIANAAREEAQNEIKRIKSEFSDLNSKKAILERSLSAVKEEALAKQKMNEVLLAEIEQDKNIKEEHQQLKSDCNSLKEQLQEEKEMNRNLKQQMNDKINTLAMDKEKEIFAAELSKQEAINQIQLSINQKKDEEVKKLNEKISSLKDELLSSQSALQDARTQLLSLRLELTQKYQQQLDELRNEKDKKIESLQSELFNRLK